MDNEEHIHLPPNSWVPICTALALAWVLVSAITFQYPIGGSSISWGEVMTPISGIFLIGCLVSWFRGARAEFLALPESIDEGGH